MSQGQRVEIEKLQGYGCFACGTANPIGLNMQFYRLNDSICSDITLGKNYRGWEKIAHGGVISAMLDEIMAWTIICFKRIFFVTRKMDIKYIKPVLIDTPLTVKGKLGEDTGEKKIKVRGEIVNESGSILARSSAEYVALPEERLDFITDDLKGEMNSLFNRLRSQLDS